MLCQLCSLFACALILFGFGLPLVCVIMMLVVVRARLAVAAHALCRTPTKLNPKRPSSVFFFSAFRPCFLSLLLYTLGSLRVLLAWLQVFLLQALCFFEVSWVCFLPSWLAASPRFFFNRFIFYVFVLLVVG